MLAGTKMAAMVSFQSACRFFSAHTWDTDRLGLAVAALIVQRLLPANAALHARRRRVPAAAADPARRDPDCPGWSSRPPPRPGPPSPRIAYGRTDTVMVAGIDALWYRPFRDTPAGRSWSANPTPPLATTWPCSPPTATTTPNTSSSATPTAGQLNLPTWSANSCSASAKPATRYPRAVERTVPFGFLTQTLMIIWYATCSHHADDLTSWAASEPWYLGETEPARHRGTARRRTIQRDSPCSRYRAGDHLSLYSR
jgi:hypothetical protein